MGNYGAITGPNGSKYWKYGLDVDLKKGDPVYSPVGGTVTYVGKNGGFGNQVKVRDANGNEVWLSHLDGLNAKVGQQVQAGQLVGKGGNSGQTYSPGGGDGSHLDITIKDANGRYFSAPQVQQYVQNQYKSSPRKPLKPVLPRVKIPQIKMPSFLDFIRGGAKLINGPEKPTNSTIPEFTWAVPGKEYDF